MVGGKLDAVSLDRLAAQEMSQHLPKFARELILADDPYLLADLRSLLPYKRTYVPLLDGPRMTRPDADHEVLRRNNAIAIVDPDVVILGGLAADSLEAMRARIPKGRLVVVDSAPELLTVGRGVRTVTLGEDLHWGPQRLADGLLKALNERRRLIVDLDESPPTDPAGIDAQHVVVCEAGKLHSEVLAANYAHALGASLVLVPEFSEDQSTDLLEGLYSSRESGRWEEILRHAVHRLREHVGDRLIVRDRMLLTFVTASIPWGIAYPTVPSTHLFRYPDLGIAIINGFAHEQPGTPGIRTALVVDPSNKDSPEILVMKTRLTDGGVFTKALRGSRATVYQVDNSVTAFPYDFLAFATHCSDISGYRQTYEFTDREGRPRTLVVDTAVSFQVSPGDTDTVGVVEFTRFVSLDGVEWTNEAGKKALPVGYAIIDFTDMKSREDDKLLPTKSEPVGRVAASMALAVAGGNYIPMPHALSGSGRISPIVLNNSCGSLHRLAGTFVFAGARAYCGTIYSILSAEAEAIAERLFGKYFGSDLAVALWRAQNDVYGDDPIRRPYVLIGCHFQRLRTVGGRFEPMGHMIRELSEVRDAWQREHDAGRRGEGLERRLRFVSDEISTYQRVRRRLLREALIRRGRLNRRRGGQPGD